MSRRRETIMSDTVSAAAIASSQDERIRQRAYEISENEGRIIPDERMAK
jgi:hypothetical protein